jgi:hypothetical protein
MKRLLHGAGAVVSLTAIVAVCLYVARMADTMDLERFAHGRAALAIALAALASGAIIPLSAVAWRRLLASCGEHRSWSTLATIMGITQLAKYLPGNVGQHVGRVALSAREGMPVGVVATTIVTESILAVLSAAAVGITGCVAAGAPILEHWMPGMGRGWISQGVVLAVAIVGAIWLAPRAVTMVVRRASGGRMSPRLPDGTALAQAFLLYVCNYLVLGSGIAVMAYFVAGIPWHDAALLTGTFAMAWILGFFVPGAPAGLGVREGAMLALLHAAGLAGDGIAVVLGIRVATTLGDILCFVVASAARLAGERRKRTLATIDKETRQHGT